MKSVCKDCQERYPACWGSCSKYLEAKAEYERKKQEKAKRLRDEHAIISVQYHATTRYKARQAKKEKYG